MQFGLCIPHYGLDVSLDELRTTVQRAEALGFHSVWVSDHVVAPRHFVPKFGSTFYDAFVILSYMGAITQRVKLGSTIIVVPYRNPLVVAKMLSTLDVLSGGRVIFGVGVGGAPDEFEALGVPSQERGRRADEYLRLMVALWTEDPTTFTGRYFSFTGVRFQPKPHQKPHPPIWVGGHSDAALRRAVALGDAWHPMAIPLTTLGEHIARLRDFAREAGRHDGPAVAVHQMMRLNDGYSPTSGEERRLGQGSSEQLREGVYRYQEMGVPVLVCNFTPDSFEELWTAMETFASDVMAFFPEPS